ncbi:hypothetical protein [Ulvibacterium sp.]|uniref:hypothetical protein n=1 Tax=Ulvibacterium sp. TaxID=2665914 RepID=UPI003BAB925F
MFEKIDSVINDWANTKNLPLLKEYQGQEVRSLNLNTKKGNQYQIWVEVESKNIVKISAWNYHKLKVQFTVTNDWITKALDKSFEIVMLWDSEI